MYIYTLIFQAYWLKHLLVKHQNHKEVANNLLFKTYFVYVWESEQILSMLICFASIIFEIKLHCRYLNSKMKWNKLSFK